jgi:hypothetical protein
MTRLIFTEPLSPEHPKRVCEPAKIFLTSKFSYLLFYDPTHKTGVQIGGNY